MNPYSWFDQYKDYIDFEASKSIDPACASKLVNSMIEISEERYYASWHTGLEFTLWEELDKYPLIKELHQQCQGWWIWGSDGEIFLTTQQWLLYKQRPIYDIELN